jgi:hypothetical protein
LRRFFPGYVGELASAAMVSRSADETIERRSNCAEQPIRQWLTRDQVRVEDDFSDTQLAELFLHHRVLTSQSPPPAECTPSSPRHDFFCALVERFGVLAEDLGD